MNIKKIIASSLLLTLLINVFVPNQTVYAEIDRDQGNIHYSGGGVDVTPLGSKELDSGEIEYSFQISLQAMQSDEKIQTAHSFHTAIPGFAKNVKFTQIGTYEKAKLGNPFDPNYVQNEYLENRMASSKDVAIPLGISTSRQEIFDSYENV